MISNSQYFKWYNGKYPYDLADCGNCASQHFSFCTDPKHQELIAAVKEERELVSPKGLDRTPGKARVAFLRLRKKFARFYPSGKRAK